MKPELSFCIYPHELWWQCWCADTSKYPAVFVFKQVKAQQLITQQLITLHGYRLCVQLQMQEQELSTETDEI